MLKLLDFRLISKYDIFVHR